MKGGGRCATPMSDLLRRACTRPNPSDTSRRRHGDVLARDGRPHPLVAATHGTTLPRVEQSIDEFGPCRP